MFVVRNLLLLWHNIFKYQYNLIGNKNKACLHSLVIFIFVQLCYHVIEVAWGHYWKNIARVLLFIFLFFYFLECYDHELSKKKARVSETEPFSASQQGQSKYFCKIYETQFVAHITRQKWNLFIEIISECFELWMDRMETDFNMKKFRQLSRQCMRIYKMCFKCDVFEKYK